ncbi:MAG: amidohydrolase family protein [Ilumatobacteraceae bacterium]
MSTPIATRHCADHLVTMAPDGQIHSPGIVDVVDGVVVWSGPAGEAPPWTGIDEQIHHVRGALTPGFVNVHAHTPMVLLRGSGEGLPTDVWLTEVMWPREARLTADDVQQAMTLGAAEMLLGGITATSEMYFYGNAIAEGAVTAGLRCIVAAPLIEAEALARFGTVDDQIESIRGLRSAWAGHPLIEIAIGPHSAYALSRESLVAVRDLIADDPMLVHIHVAEQRSEGDGVLAATGLTVPAYLDDIGLLGARCLAAHCVWMTDEDIALFAAHGVGVGHCPVSNGRHASGIARVVDMREAGIAVGLGTDGPASHDRLDPFEEMRTAVRYARIATSDASQLDATQVFTMATCEAADALGRPDLGRLTPGSRADMIEISLDGPGSPPFSDPDPTAAELLGRIVWGSSPSRVAAVWVQGTQVVANGRHLTVDLDALALDVAGRARRISAAQGGQGVEVRV